MADHWPTNMTTCACGDTFPNQAEHHRHARAYVAGMNGVSFTPTDPDSHLARAWHAEWAARWSGGYGHRFVLRRSRLAPSRWELICSCGWRTVPARRNTLMGRSRISKQATEHIREKVRRLIDGEDGIRIRPIRWDSL